MPDFLDDVMASDNEQAKSLLRLLGVAEKSECHQHEWVQNGTINGKRVWDCQTCGATRQETTPLKKAVRHA